MLCQVGVCDAVWSQIRRHLQVHRQDASAFGKDTLLSSRWLLGSSAPADKGIWYQVLQVDATNQKAFMDRILLLRGLSLRRRTSKATSCRLALLAWDKEM